MNLFTEHTHKQGLTYIEHWCFAMGIAWRLMNSMAAFTVHAIFPFISIARKLDFEATIAFIHERNEWIAYARENKHFDSPSTNEGERETGKDGFRAVVG
jgi:hypothetical protein